VSDGPKPLLQTKEVVLFIVLASLIPLAYALYTQHVWEDFLITFRHSQNLCEGHGLVYNVGQRVRGFTSPLGVLLPALCYQVTGQTGYTAALWLFRIVSIMAFVTGGLCVFKSLAGQTPAARLVPYAFALLYVLELKSVAYSVNGQETAFMLLFLGWAFALLQAGGLRRWLAAGICWAGLMWTRPDGFIFIIALLIAHRVFVPDERRAHARAVLKSGLVALAVYLPWLVWAWHYYGSPIPNTIWAKAAKPEGPFGVGTFLADLYTNFPHRAAQVFAPFYYPMIWNEPAWIGAFAYALGIFCSVYWLVPTGDRVGRMASLGFSLTVLYFAPLRYLFPWYSPPAALFALVVLSRGVSTLGRALARAVPRPDLVSRGLLAVVAAEMACVFVLTTRLIRIQEREVEMGNRAVIGRWLKERVRPQETVFVEPVGYIGYFNQAHIVDFPGLVSPEIVRLRREQHLGFSNLIGPVQPDWVVLRPWEVGWS
jgi:hypothetical protein